MAHMVASVLLAQALAAGAARPFRQVRCTQGAARGYLVGRPPHYAFLGLPYAGSPTPRRRYKAPEPPPSWDGIFEATHRVKCPQAGAGDENCLVLNVFAPPGAAALPVLVLVHDGHFQNGWGAYTPPRSFLKDFITVTFNYRLGILGFLCLGTPDAPGNAGLKDQVAALYWVQRNIGSFGGNHSDVTLYALGTGAAAVQMLLLSGVAEGLFQKVILESGSLLSPFSFNYDPILLAKNAAIKLGFKNKDNISHLAEYFQRVPASKLTNLTDVFLPCIENNYEHSLIERDLLEVLKTGKFQQVPILMYFTNLDGFILIKKMLEKLTTAPHSFEDLLPSNLKFNTDETKLKIAQAVKEIYFDNIHGIEQNYADYFQDVMFEYPIVKFGALYAAKGTPLYILKYIFRDNQDNNRIIDYISGNKSDETDVGILVMLLRNFIKLGDPTPIIKSQIPVIWQAIQDVNERPVNIQTAPILYFNATLTMSSAGENQKLAFWDYVYRKFYREHTLT